MVESNPLSMQEPGTAGPRGADGPALEPPTRRPRLAARMEARLTGMAWRSVFRFLNLRLKVDRRFRRLIFRPAGQNGSPVVPDDWRSTIVLASRDGAFAVHAVFGGGRVKHGRGAIANPDLTLTFRNVATARTLLTHPPAEMLEMMLRSDLVMSGNLSHASRLGYLLTALAPRGGRKPVPPRRSVTLPEPRRSLESRPDDEVRFLEDPGLSGYTIDDFPRLARFRQDFFSTSPEMCAERPRLYTEYLRRHGFEHDDQGARITPVLRQAEAFKYLMSQRKPLIRAGDLLAGTTTGKDIGVVVYPECGGVVIWSELKTLPRRELNPYRISAEDERILNEEVFPFWIDRNVREFTRQKYDNPRSIQLDERFALYFQWKTQGVSHTIPDFPAVLQRGLVAIRDEALAALAQVTGDEQGQVRRDQYRAMALCIDGVLDYSANLSHLAAEQARGESDPERRAELMEIARLCAKVPAEPATTLHEALQAMWTVFIACHMESSNTGFSVGRMDYWLAPYFTADIEAIPAADPEARRAYIRKAIELCGCFFMRLTDHLPQVADLGNKLFGGSSSVQAITVGGVTDQGQNAVSDMTYILLKVTEMLGMRDPNINARYYDGVNSLTYLKRLCEVNLLTGATPSIHNDRGLIEMLEGRGFTPEHARDWCPTGCVEPTSCGRDYGNTNCMLFNMVAPLEMALRDGYHPLLEEQVGPHTGKAETFTTFEQLLEAYCTQLSFLIDTAFEANNLFGEVHKFIRPVPFLSAIIQGPMEKGLDLSEGGALYNSSGTGNVGLVDVIDSLMAIKKVVFEERQADMATLLLALDADFEGHEELWTRLSHKVPKFGSGEGEPKELLRRVMAFCFDAFSRQPHYRGGYYKPGYWSMSNHVAFGILSGALPSGRKKGQPFTPGITPAPARGANLSEHIHDVAAIDSRYAPNNLAFNVKVVPAPHDTQRETVERMAAYVRTYVQEGGLQMQFNVVSNELLRDAMAHPGKYPSLMVRISGYNAYFDDLNDDMKLELIARTEHPLGA